MNKIRNSIRDHLSLGVLSFFIILTAITSVGYHQPDEFFQMLEFCSYLLGQTGSDTLAWEYEAHIRPSIQVWLAYIVSKPLSLICINPFIQTIIFRLLTAILSIFTFWQAFLYIKKTFPSLRGYALLIPFCVWFFPYIAVRYNSETWSACLFFTGLFYFLNNKENTSKAVFIIVGLLHGLSFLFRFQTGFMILSFSLWMIFNFKKSIRIHLVYYFLLLTICIFFIGVLLDYFFYQEFTFTPWNYFKVNIMQDKASKFGVEAWYYYFLQLPKKSFYPIGVFIFVSIYMFLTQKRNHPISWVLSVFILVHILIPHKEERFLFPIIYTLPITIAYFIQRYHLWKRKVIIVLFVSLNVCFMSYVLTRVARIESVMQKSFYMADKANSLFLYNTSSPFPLYHIYGNSTTFYHQNKKRIEERKVDDFEDIRKERLPKNIKTLFIQTLDPQAFENNPFLKKRCKSIYQVLPQWVTTFGLGFQYIAETDRIHGFYACDCHE